MKMKGYGCIWISTLKADVWIQLTDIERNVLEYLLTHLDQALKLEYVVWPGKL